MVTKQEFDLFGEGKKEKIRRTEIPNSGKEKQKTFGRS